MEQEPNEVLSDIEKRTALLQKQLEEKMKQLNNFMRPIETKKIEGAEVHIMTGNVIMIKCNGAEQQKKIVELLTK